MTDSAYSTSAVLWSWMLSLLTAETHPGIVETKVVTEVL